MKNPLLSIIIPTKNRYEYLKEVINIILKIENKSLELIIQDNSANDDDRTKFFSYLQGIEDDRLKYFYHESHLSVVENCDKSVLNANGKYLCLIGDDDCVTSQIMDAVEWMEEKSLDVLTFNNPIYIWNDVEYKYLSNKHTGVLTFKLPKGKISIMNPQKELNKLLKQGGQFIKDLPKFYHSIVSRELLLKIYQRTGSFFPGSSPDMAVAVALSLYANKHYNLDVPIVISGTAKKSAGGMGAAKTHKGDLQKIPHLPSDTIKTWDPLVPFYWSGPTIYADSVYKCLNRTDNQALLRKYNYNYLYATLMVFQSDFYHATKKAMLLNKKTSWLKIIYYSIFLVMLRTSSYIINRAPGIFKMGFHKKNISSISDAANYLEEMIDNINLPWKINP